MSDYASVLVLSTLVNSALGVYNGAMGRQQQEKITQQNADMQLKILKNQQDFQSEQNIKNISAQIELNRQNYRYRLEEADRRYRESRLMAEWEAFLRQWPLKVLPYVIRDEQLNSGDNVALRVIFSKSRDPIFEKLVYPKVEQGLRDFVDIYHNIIESKNIIFYHNGFKDGEAGGAVDSNIHAVLNGLPVIIIETNVLDDEICISFTMWGLGSSEMRHFNVFKIPYRAKIENGRVDEKYYSDITQCILAELKFILGYAYDAYNLIEYKKAPLLPQAMELEKKLGARGCILDNKEITATVGSTYKKLYNDVLGKAVYNGEQQPVNSNLLSLDFMRLRYAEAVKGWITQEEYAEYLDEACEAWIMVKTTEEPMSFLKKAADGEVDFDKYFTHADIRILRDLRDAFEKSECKGKALPSVAELNKKLDEKMSRNELKWGIPKVIDNKPEEKEGTLKKIKQDIKQIDRYIKSIEDVIWDAENSRALARIEKFEQKKLYRRSRRI